MGSKSAVVLSLVALAILAPPPVAAIELGELIIRKGNLIEVVGPDPALDLQALIDDISGETADNRFLIRLGPGEYDLGAETLVLKPYVDLSGSGRDTTEIVGDRSDAGGACGTDSGVVAASDHSVLSELTVSNVSSSTSAATAVCNLPDSSPTIRRVKARTLTTSEGARYAFNLDGGSPELTEVEATANGGDPAHALRCIDATPLVIGAQFVTKNGDSNRGIWLVGTCALEIRGLLLSVEGDAVNKGAVVQDGTELDLSNSRLSITSSTSNTGIDVTGGKVLLYDVRVHPQGGSVDNRGINAALDSVVKVFRSSIVGDPNAIVFNSTEDAVVSQSSLSGDVDVLGAGGVVTCIASDNGDGVALASDCSVPP